MQSEARQTESLIETNKGSIRSCWDAHWMHCRGAQRFLVVAPLAFLWPGDGGDAKGVYSKSNCWILIVAFDFCWGEDWRPGGARLGDLL